MQAFLDAINKNSGSINLLFSLVVAGATVFYAVLTHRLVAETKRMREVQTEPSLSLWIEPSEHGINFINFIIENSGQGVAHSITLESIPNFQRFSGKYLGDLGLFKHGIRHLAPRQRISFFLTSVLDGHHGTGNELARLDFVVKARYKSALGRDYSDEFPIHFESFEGYGTIGTPPLISLARDLEKIQKDVGHVASGFNRLQVAVHTQRDVAREREELDAWHEQQRLKATKNASAVSPVPQQDPVPTTPPVSAESIPTPSERAI
jgi:hypothetical protein